MSFWEVISHCRRWMKGLIDTWAGGLTPVTFVTELQYISGNNVDTCAKPVRLSSARPIMMWVWSCTFHIPERSHMNKGSIVGRSGTSHSCVVKVLWMKMAASDEMLEILQKKKEKKMHSAIKQCESFFFFCIQLRQNNEFSFESPLPSPPSWEP